MTHILVAYASKRGSTGEIADAIADVLRQSGLEVDCKSAGEVGSLDSYDGIVLGSAVYMKRWRGDAKHFLRKHGEELSRLPFWVFSSGPVGDPSKTPTPRGLSRHRSSTGRGSSVCAITLCSAAGCPRNRVVRSSARWSRTHRRSTKTGATGTRSAHGVHASLPSCTRPRRSLDHRIPSRPRHVVDLTAQRAPLTGHKGNDDLRIGASGAVAARAQIAGRRLLRLAER